MNILSQSSIALVGATPTGLPFPPVFPDNSVQASFLAVCNIGPCDCYVKVGQTAGVAADATSNLIAAANYQGLPGQLRSLSAVAIGPFITIPLAPGDLFFSAIAVPVQVVAAYTNGTASAESVTVTLDSATGVAVGQTVEDYGGLIQAGTTVVSVVSTTVTLSQPTTGALSETPLQFSAAPTVQPPGIIVVALGT